MEESSRPSLDQPILGGFLGGLLGFVGGGLIGAGLQSIGGCDPEFPGCFPGFVLGATVGEVVLLPVGVHIGNRSQGSLRTGIATSAAVALGFFAIVGATGVEELLYAAPIAQIGLCTQVERESARPR